MSLRPVDLASERNSRTANVLLRRVIGDDGERSKSSDRIFAYARSRASRVTKMRMRSEVSAEKLRGGYYTPAGLVQFCLERASQLLDGDTTVAMLEPSAGDGAFVRGLARARGSVGRRVSHVRALEIVPEEAAKVQLSLDSTEFAGLVECRSVLGWAAETDEWFGLVVGNPPFVRYQFVPDSDKAAISRLGIRLGLTFDGVANLWIPVLLGSLSRLEPRGVLAVVLPTECFTGSSARLVREWLSREVEDLTFDLFPPGSFPDVLQEVAVVSGRRVSAGRTRSVGMRIVEHGTGKTSSTRQYRPSPGERNWTRSLLEPGHLDAVTVACALPAVMRLASVARIEVGIVTGANAFFCVDDATLHRHELGPWARPLLAKTRHSPGIVFGEADYLASRTAGATSWLLDFAAHAPDPMACPAAWDYLQTGLELGLQHRYKCRIRDPWFRVPSVRSGSLMLSKRSHLYPRLLANAAGVFTTDTMYRGSVLPMSNVSPGDVVAGFHSSLTLLTAEIEGRSFGGGVLELVPSEIARLAIAVSPGIEHHLATLDRVARASDPEDLIAETDRLLVRHRLLPADLVATLAEARQSLMHRRLRRAAPVESSRDGWEARAA